MLHSGALNPRMLTAWCGFRPSWMNALAASLMTHTRGNTMVFQCCGSGIPDPGSGFFHTGSRIRGLQDIPDPDPHQRISVFLTPKIVFKVWKI
jgi:hypothetical protein